MRQSACSALRSTYRNEPHENVRHVDSGLSCLRGDPVPCLSELNEGNTFNTLVVGAIFIDDIDCQWLRVCGKNWRSHNLKPWIRWFSTNRPTFTGHLIIRKRSAGASLFRVETLTLIMMAQVKCRITPIISFSIQGHSNILPNFLSSSSQLHSSVSHSSTRSTAFRPVGVDGLVPASVWDLNIHAWFDG